jgi:hypothetical protein
LLHRANLYRRFIAAAADWLSPKRIKIYTLSLPLVAAAVILADFFVDNSPSLLYGGDFILFYTGGRFLLTNRLSELYDFAAQEAFQVRTLGLQSLQITPFNHPPFTTLLYAPFAFDGFELGLVLWSAAGLMALMLGWGVLRKELTPLASYSTIGLTFLSFCFYPTVAWFLANQNSPLTFLLYSVFYVELRKGRDLPAGAALGLLLYKPQLMLAPVFLVLIKKRWRALIGWFLASVLLIGLGFALSHAAMLTYFRTLPQIAQFPFVPGYPISKMHNFYGLCVLLLGGFFQSGIIKFLTLLLTLGGVLTIVWWWRSVPWQPASRSWDLSLASTLALGLLISPHLMFYDLLILLLPLAIVWSHYPNGTNGRALDDGPLLVWTALVYGSAFVSTYLSFGVLQMSTALGLPKFAVQISVLIVLGWAAVVRRAADAEESDQVELGFHRNPVQADNHVSSTLH